MSRRVLALVAIGVLLVALVGAYVVASLSWVAADHAAATAALDAVGKRNNQVYAALADPKLNAQLNSAADARSMADALSEIRARLGGSMRLVEEQLAELRNEESRLQRDRQSPLALVGRNQLDQDLRRIAAARQAFEAGDHLLTTEDAHTKAVDTIVGAMLKLNNVGDWVQAGNIPQAAALVPSLKQTVQDAATLAQAPGQPPQLRPLIDAFKQLADDVGQFLDAVQANEGDRAQALYATLQADSDRLAASFDADAFTKFERDTLAPYRAEYERGMAKAGFRLTGSAGA